MILYNLPSFVFSLMTENSIKTLDAGAALGALLPSPAKRGETCTLVLTSQDVRKIKS